MCFEFAGTYHMQILKIPPVHKPKMISLTVKSKDLDLHTCFSASWLFNRERGSVFCSLFPISPRLGQVLLTSLRGGGGLAGLWRRGGGGVMFLLTSAGGGAEFLHHSFTSKDMARLCSSRMAGARGGGRVLPPLQLHLGGRGRCRWQATLVLPLLIDRTSLHEKTFCAIL